jgi:hypothetical protein
LYIKLGHDDLLPCRLEAIIVSPVLGRDVQRQHHYKSELRVTLAAMNTVVVFNNMNRPSFVF